jgi:hypothetical protein
VCCVLGVGVGHVVYCVRYSVGIMFKCLRRNLMCNSLLNSSSDIVGTE